MKLAVLAICVFALCSVLAPEFSEAGGCAGGNCRVERSRKIELPRVIRERRVERRGLFR